MEQTEKPKYATLMYEVREKVGVSWHEYILLEMVYHLSHKTGYCYKTAGSIASDMGMTKQGVNKIILRLSQKKLLERLSDNAVRVTPLYNDSQNLSGNKVSEWKQSFRQSGNKVTKVETKLTGRKQSSPKNNSKKDSKNNKYPKLEPELQEFIKHRNSSNKTKLSEYALGLIIKKLQSWYPDDYDNQRACLAQTIENGWIGIFKLKDELKPAKHQTYSDGRKVVRRKFGGNNE